MNAPKRTESPPRLTRAQLVVCRELRRIRAARRARAIDVGREVGAYSRQAISIWEAAARHEPGSYGPRPRATRDLCRWILTHDHEFLPLARREVVEEVARSLGIATALEPAIAAAGA